MRLLKFSTFPANASTAPAPFLRSSIVTFSCTFAIPDTSCLRLLRSIFGSRPHNHPQTFVGPLCFRYCVLSFPPLFPGRPFGLAPRSPSRSLPAVQLRLARFLRQYPPTVPLSPLHFCHRLKQWYRNWRAIPSK